MTPSLTPQQTTRLGIDHLSEAEQAEIIHEIDAAVFGHALEQLRQELSDEAVARIDRIIEKSQSIDTLLELFSISYPQFFTYYERSIETYIATAADEASRSSSQPTDN